MKYEKPEIRQLASAANAIQHAQCKGFFALVDTIFPVLLFATPMAYEGDE